MIEVITPERDIEYTHRLDLYNPGPGAATFIASGIGNSDAEVLQDLESKLMHTFGICPSDVVFAAFREGYFNWNKETDMTHYKVLLSLYPDEGDTKAGKAPEMLFEWEGFAPTERLALVLATYAAVVKNLTRLQSALDTPGRLVVMAQPFCAPG